MSPHRLIQMLTRSRFAAVTNGLVVASKVGWRQSFAGLENSKMPETVISDAREIVDCLEARLGDIKVAARKREVQELTSRAREILASSGAPAMTREQRMAEARDLRRAVERRN